MYVKLRIFILILLHTRRSKTSKDIFGSTIQQLLENVGEVYMYYTYNIHCYNRLV